MRLSTFCLLLLLTACARQHYTTRSFNQAALATHRTVAILPFDVALDRLRMRDISYAGTGIPTKQQVAQHQQHWTAQQQQERRTTAYELQRQLRAQLALQRPKSGYFVRFQEPEETNRRLLQAGITYDNLFDHGMTELQQALGADAVLSGQTLLSQPVPNGLNVAARILLDQPTAAQLPSNTAITNLTLHDCRSGELLWRFDYERAGSASLKPKRLTHDLVRAAASSFPYHAR